MIFASSAVLGAGSQPESMMLKVKMLKHTKGEGLVIDVPLIIGSFIPYLMMLIVESPNRKRLLLVICKSAKKGQFYMKSRAAVAFGPG